MNTYTSQADGPFDQRYRAFLETVVELRPALHRYCSRMTGSTMDGEDIVQDALFDAYRKLDSYDDTRPLSPWLFRIAHNRCIDFLRKRGMRAEVESDAANEPTWDPPEAANHEVNTAIESLVTELPPMERACVLLKEVFEYSLQETAELVGSTVGGVKAALHRGRTKLTGVSGAVARKQSVDPELGRLLHLYVDRFNHQDWEGLRELITDDARLRVADRYWGSVAKSPYFGTYSRMPVPWRLRVGEADGEPVIVCQRLHGTEWASDSLIRIHRVGDRIQQIVDYLHTPWVFALSTIVVL
jgi:RNA polymerase sigma-70 factor, ECF subfamily